MTDHEWQTALATIVGLWPDKAKALTHEQVNVWRSVCDPYPWEWCQQELRGLAMTIKFYPRPCELAERLKGRRQSGKSNKDRLEPTQGDLGRANLLQAWPDRRETIETMSDNEAAHELAKHFYYRAVKTYGQAARGTVAAYWQWQQAAHGAGLRDTPVEHRGWSPESERQYRIEQCLPLEVKEANVDQTPVTASGVNDDDSCIIATNAL